MKKNDNKNENKNKIKKKKTKREKGEGKNEYRKCVYLTITVFIIPKIQIIA